VVLIINALIGTIQEYSAEQAATALKKMVPSFATVIRDNNPHKISTADIVPGDLVQLVSGDKVPADIILSSQHQLQIDESMLTGESIAATKLSHTDSSKQSKILNHENICYAGTVVMHGRGTGNVLATGAYTEIGKIAADVELEQTKPPLLLRIENFTLRITYSIFILIAFIFLITISRGDDIDSVFFLGVALAVSAIPEGLPAAITIALAIGMRRMAKQQVIIRNLLAVEALGSCTYIASDKTGTLTVNEMTIRKIELACGTNFEVSGVGLDLHGEIIEQSNNNKIIKHEVLELLCNAGILTNESYTQQTPAGLQVHGDMVDIALLIMAEKYGLEYQQTRAHYPELAKIPYESENAYSASINRYNGKYYIFVKGSVEKLLSMCSKAELCHELNPQQLESQSTSLASQGYRVLGIAYGILDEMPDKPEDALQHLSFLGMVGMIDPLRPEVQEAVEQCKKSSIKIAMITGDHPQTAIALARQAGIADDSMQAVTGKQLTTAYKQGKESFKTCVHSSYIFARVAPHQKKQIIEQLMNDGDFVAVTGDGVNDAPALSHAHVGISMGLRGTDVARESSDLILTDDNFASIVKGIKQGRIVYNNIRKVIFLLISTGAAEIMLVILSLIFGTALPLFPIQLLWLNLVTNGIQDIALAFEPAEGNELNNPPRPPNEAIFNRLMIERVIINAIVMGFMAFAIFKWQLDQGVTEQEARNVTLLLMVLFENVHVLNSRSETVSIFKQYFFGNKFLLFGMLAAQGVHIAAMYTPGLKDILQIQPVSLQQWLWLLSVALILILVNELYKKIINNATRRATNINMHS